MNNLNSILVEGVLDDDPIYRIKTNGEAVCTFRIVSRRYSRNDTGALDEEVSYLGIEARAKVAKQVDEQGYTGRGVRVVGRLKQEYYTDARGKERERFFIVAEHVEFKPDDVNKRTHRK
jgi:single-strand DNA-binding protein